MSRLFRTLCVGLCAALVAVLSLHAVQESRHRLVHAADWPTMAVADGHHAHEDDDRHEPAHAADAPDAPSGETADAADNGDDGGSGRPAGHHHHSGGDSHTAMPALGRNLDPALLSSAVMLQPGGDASRPSHDGDGPEYPPKRTRTII